MAMAAMKRQMARMLVLAVLASGLMLAAAPSASAHHGSSGCNSFAMERPYYHTDFWGRRWIYGHAYSHCTIGVVRLSAQANLMQYYGGRWHYVGHSSPEDYEWGTRYNRTNKPARVLCSKPYTPYYFATRAGGYMEVFRTGWFTTDPHISALRVMYC